MIHDKIINAFSSVGPTLFNIHYYILDTAAVYNNEEYIKQALQVLLPKYHLKREDLFITSKLGI